MSRLPKPGKDADIWGEILNDFLSVSLNTNGTIKSSAVSGKANDAGVVHNTGDESIAGIKTFAASPLVPTPTGTNQVANKSYVDGVALAGAPDATSSTKGVVQLTGDLGGTAASPTVPGLAGKANTTTTISAGTGLTGGGDLSANRTLSVSYGAVAGTAAQGDDSRITGAIQKSTVTTKGDLLTATAAATIARLGVGTDGQVLTADSAQSTGLKWATPSGTTADATTSTKGVVQLAGDLGGTGTTAAAPVITDGAITDAKVSGTAAIAQSKIGSLFAGQVGSKVCDF